jgi:hypothetical protein
MCICVSLYAYAFVSAHLYVLSFLGKDQHFLGLERARENGFESARHTLCTYVCLKHSYSLLQCTSHSGICYMLLGRLSKSKSTRVTLPCKGNVCKPRMHMHMHIHSYVNMHIHVHAHKRTKSSQLKYIMHRTRRLCCLKYRGKTWIKARCASHSNNVQGCPY